MSHRALRALWCAWVLCLAVVEPAAAVADTGLSLPSFRTEIVPLLTKAGCNQGACHGNQSGKGGFRLSLRGEQPELDLHSIALEHGGRRVDLLQADNSLLLQKATAQLSHQGGQRFLPDHPGIALLEQWIQAGCPEDPDPPVLSRIEVSPQAVVLSDDQSSVHLDVTAEFRDGSRRSVNFFSVFESLFPEVATVDEQGVVTRQGDGEAIILVRYLGAHQTARIIWGSNRPVPDLPIPSGTIDRIILSKLAETRHAPAGPCDDATYIRRVYLDLAGMLPTAEQARSFVADPRPDKRSRLVDELLVSPETAIYWSLKWADMLRCEELVLDPQGVSVFRRYLFEAVAIGLPLDQFVQQLLVTRGSTYEQPAANFFRAQRTPAQRGETVARLFLGARLACAQCHNHPFDRWTQNDYYRWLAVFAEIDYEIKDNRRRDDLDKNEFNGEQLVVARSNPDPIRHPRTDAEMVPQLLGEPGPLAGGRERTVEAADWLVAPANRRFSQTMANWLWKQLLGRGIVEPWDDFRDSNPPSHPELLEYLADRLVRMSFDWRAVVREIMSSDAYQSQWLPEQTNGPPPQLFAQQSLRRLTAEQLLDAQSQVLGVPCEFPGYPRGTRAAGLSAPRHVRGREQLTSAENLLRAFGRPARLLSCDCERSDETSLAQSLLLIGDASLEQRLNVAGGNAARWARSELSGEELVDEMYWATLSRSPTAEEVASIAPIIDQSNDRLASVSDLLWSLINCKEFLFRH